MLPASCTWSPEMRKRAVPQLRLRWNRAPEPPREVRNEVVQLLAQLLMAVVVDDEEERSRDAERQQQDRR